MSGSDKVKYATLTAGVVSTVTFTGCPSSKARVRVMTDGASSSRLYFRADGQIPAVDGDGSYCLLGSTPGWKELDLTTTNGGVGAVKLVSNGTPWASVEVIEE